MKPLIIWTFPLLGPSDLILESGKEFICQECGKVFNDRSNCRRHVRAVHFAEIPEKCPICGNVLKNKNSLSCHIRMYHPEAKEMPKFWL